jgi:preprotein translocase subunit YajC
MIDAWRARNGPSAIRLPQPAPSRATQPAPRRRPTGALPGVPMFLISDALAQTAPAAQPGPESMWTSILFMVLIFVVFYFLLIRPQVKRQKEHKALVDSLNKGDEVLTAGGLIGKVTELTDQYATIQISSVDNKPVEISIQRAAVQTLLPKGTMKSI